MNKEGKTYIIAEAGVNHNGNISIAKELIDRASDAGADAVKFQTFKADSLVTVSAEKADYQKVTSDMNESQYQMIKKLELSYADHIELIQHCKVKGINFLSSPFDIESIELLAGLGMEIFKIPSGEITNLPYLEIIGQLNKEVILSTGMSELTEVENALRAIEHSGTSIEKVTVLHANTEYPTPMQDVNLTAMATIRKAFGVNVGYSDHTVGIEIPIAAVALGASVIEKHFTLDRKMKGPDHKASLEPNELKRMVETIRNIEQALGDGVKQPSISERKNINIARKSIVASSAIKKGQPFTAENLTTKRPGTGISPMAWHDIIGNIAKKDYEKDEMIKL